MSQDHSHTHPNETHDHHHAHGHGHNKGPYGDHMHSHVHSDPEKERIDRLSALAASFIEGFRKAENKPGFLDLAGIPLHRHGSDGLKMHLIDAVIDSRWQLGTASPAFARRELAYLPYPAAMIQERETMTFTYVSLTERADIDLMTLLNERQSTESKEHPK
ncbi:MAG: hypothetical protein AAGD23_04835 [Pseudomonadota bacterium]